MQSTVKNIRTLLQPILVTRLGLVYMKGREKDYTHASNSPGDFEYILEQ